MTFKMQLFLVCIFGLLAAFYAQNTILNSSDFRIPIEPVKISELSSFDSLYQSLALVDLSPAPLLSGNLTLNELATQNYPKFISCLSHNPQRHKFDNLQFPNETEVEAHYRDLLYKTQAMREVYMHFHSSYGGPWIENYFIKSFIDKPLSYFGGLVPLFIQWTDIHVHSFNESRNDPNYSSRIPAHDKMPEIVASMLRDDVIYVAVSQDDQGITAKLAALKPNILSISAGGYGNIPIPLVKGELRQVEQPDRYEHDLGFFGTARAVRLPMLHRLRKCSSTQGLKFKQESSPHWLHDMAYTKFNFAPRGFGRTSFRLAEVIQLGRVPIYAYDDVPWLPYEGSNRSVRAMGLVSHLNILDGLCSTVKKLSPAEYRHKLKLVQEGRYYYTYKGVIEQIGRFFENPFGDSSLLRCTPLPPKDHRRL